MEKNKKIDNQEKINKLKESATKLKEKQSTFLFCVPEIQTPSALIYEIYFHANVVEKMGYKVIMLTDKEEFTPPDYIEDELINKEHKAMGGSDLVVGPNDFMVIPEIFSNVMEQTKDLPCKRIVLLQSFDYMLNALIPGGSFRDFKIEDIITTSDTLKDCVNLFFENDHYNIKTYDIGIPGYFNKTDAPKKPVVSIVGRNPNDISKIVKLFYAKYPQYRWISFDAMLTKSKPPQPLRRVDFADKLKKNFAGVWIDRISSFGTFPLECMKAGTIPVSLKPDITPDYIIDKSDKKDLKIKDNLGLWTKDFYDIPFLLGDVVTRFLDDSIPEEIYTAMEKTASNYTQENAEKQITNIYNEYIDERIKLFDKAIDDEEKIG